MPNRKDAAPYSFNRERAALCMKRVLTASEGSDTHVTEG